MVPPARMTARASSTISRKLLVGSRRRYLREMSVSVLEKKKLPSLAGFMRVVMKDWMWVRTGVVERRVSEVEVRVSETVVFGSEMWML